MSDEQEAAQATIASFIKGIEKKLNKALTSIKQKLKVDGKLEAAIQRELMRLLRLPKMRTDLPGRTNRHRPFCLLHDSPGPLILQLMSRSPSTSHGWIPSELDRDEGLCQSFLELGEQSPGQSSERERVSGSPVTGDTSLASPTWYPVILESLCNYPRIIPKVSGLDSGSGTIKLARDLAIWPASSVGTKLRSFQKELQTSWCHGG